MSTSSSGTSVATGVPPPGVAGGLGGQLNQISFGGISGGGTVSAPTTSGGQLVSQDQGSLTQYFLNTVGATPVQGSGLPGELGTAATIGQALQDLYMLSPAQLQGLQHALLGAGYFENADGSPMRDIGGVALGQVDNQTWLAFGRALLEASQHPGQSVMSTIQQRQASGLGAAQQNTLPSPVQGGGNVYEIDLTQPGAVNEVTNSIFKAALGRNASGDEINKVLAAVNAGELQQGRGRVAAGENASQQKYQASVNERNIAYQFEKNPKTAFGAVPSGPFNNLAEWASGLLQYMSLPQTPQNIAFLTAFARQMGGDPLNPLKATNPAAGSTPGAGGASQFQSIAQGLQATAEELLNAKFSGIYDALNTGNPTAYAGVGAAVNVWSGGKFSTVSPTAAENKQANQQTLVINQQSQGAQQIAQQPQPVTGTAQSMGAEGGGPGVAGGVPTSGTAQSLGAEGGGPSAPPTGTPSATLNVGQQPPNPGDQYINPTVATLGTPLTPEQAAYQEATTGANRFSFAENNYLNAFLAATQMIRAGGPTG